MISDNLYIYNKFNIMIIKLRYDMDGNVVAAVDIW
jgi:hypothetical protein